MIEKQTTLDLNGPILSFTQNPSSLEICSSSTTTGIATFIGIATAIFPTQSPSNNASNTGYIAYQWYDNNGPLVDGQNVAGSATTTLTLYNNIDTKTVYLKADYVPSAYGEDPITVGTARSTPNAINDGLNSSSATLSIKPEIEITNQPDDVTTAKQTRTTFQVEATIRTIPDKELEYQWQIDGFNLKDGSFSSSLLDPVESTISVTDDLGNVFTINFDKVSYFSGFVSGRVYTLVSNKDISTKILALGGHGGTDTYRSARGGRGGVAEGEFTFVAGNKYKLIIGGGAKGRVGGYGGGGNGDVGGAGGVGGGGGGYTGLFSTSISRQEAILIAGGGGGGANESEEGGGGGGLVGGHGQTGVKGGTQTAGGIGDNHGGRIAGNDGSSLTGGSGVAGGGGGYYGGAGGGGNYGCCDDWAGGGGSGYLHPNLITNGKFTSDQINRSDQLPESDGLFKINLIGKSANTTFTVSGSKTSTLTISSTNFGLSEVRCKISHPRACNTSIFSNSAILHVVDFREIINVELLPGYGGSATLYTRDLFNQGPFTITSTDVTAPNIMCFYSPEKDLDVFIELYANSGSNYAGFGFKGGEGGVSTIRLKLKRNVEYIISSLSQLNDGNSIWLYEQSRLIACVGGGGNAGYGGNGGNGGGVNVAGQNGSGKNAGSGGELIPIGTLTTSGIFGSTVNNSRSLRSGDQQASAPNGGRSISCPKGGYWYEQGYSPCQNMGFVKFYTASNGVISNSTSSISRGFKSGYGIRQTSGSGISGGDGGNGATGGNGGVNGGGGGGGSGYSDGTATIISTQQGGNIGYGKVVIKSVNVNQTYSRDYYIDSQGRILIFSSATPGKDPRTLSKTTGKVLIGSDSCIDDERWQEFIELAKTQNYRLTATLDNSSVAVTKATDYNIKKMIDANYIPLKTSLTDWELVPYSYPFYVLAWDETSYPSDPSNLGFGSDYSILSWGGTTYYYGYYGQSINSFFNPTTYSNLTANWWILPPGIPDFT